MEELSYQNLLLVGVVGALAPVVLGLLPRLRLPSVVVAIAVGVVLGPAVLGVVQADLPVTVLSWLGLTFLLFLAGLEIDPTHLRGPLVRAAGLGYLLSLALATPVALGLAAVGWIGTPHCSSSSCRRRRWASSSRSSATPARRPVSSGRPSS